MDDRPDWAPAGVDTTTPSSARVYDALLGGTHHFPVDAAAAKAGLDQVPDLAAAAAMNRRFLARAIRSLVAEGIEQFLDVGAGIPTVGNTHDIVHEPNPDGTVVYVDHDPVAVSQATALLDGVDNATAIHGDLLRPAELLAAVEETDLIDFGRPVGLLLVAVLHLIPDGDDPQAAVEELREALGPGSGLVVSHLTTERRAAEAGDLSAGVARRDGVNLVFRSAEAIEEFFGDFALLKPGLVHPHDWRPDTAERHAGPEGSSLFLSGVGFR